MTTNPSRSIIVRAALVTVLATGLLLGGAGPAGAGFPKSGYRIKNWSPQFMARTWDYSRAEAVTHAKRFDVIVAVKEAYDGNVRAMKAANPDLRLLAYLNGSFVLRRHASRYADRLFARDSDGDKIRSKRFGNYLMDVSLSDWRKAVIDRCRAWLRFSGYDGCFLDTMGVAPLNPRYVTGLPVNRATGKVWTERQWLSMTSGISAAVRQRIKPRLVTPNGITWGGRYFHDTAPTEVLLNGTDGAMVELFVREAHQGVSTWRPESDWLKDVRMLIDAGKRKDSLLVVTKVWTSATKEQIRRWHRYALATFLLGTNGRAYFSFLQDKVATRGHRWWNLKLGGPKGRFYKKGGVYRRDFRRGKVVVNPTGSTYRVRLGGRYIDLSGRRVRRITLGPHGAQILRKA